MGRPAVDRSALPAQVRRWIDRVLPEGTPIPERVRLAQEGEMQLRPGSRWIRWKAEEDFEIRRLGFEWRARFRLAPLVWLSVADGLREGYGWGSARFWGLIRVVDEKGPHVVKPQLVLNLGELAWIPHAVLANPDLEWRDLSDRAFELRTSVGRVQATTRFELDEHGDVVRASAPDRPRDIEGGFVDTPYFNSFSEHADMAGVRIPTYGEAGWDLPEGPCVYSRVHVSGVLVQ